MCKQTAVSAAILVLLVSSCANGAIPLTGKLGDDIISLVYDPADGGLELDIAGKEITAIEIVSAGKHFTGKRPEQWDCFFCEPVSPYKLFLLKPGNTRFKTDQDFGTPLAKGLSKETIAADLTVSGALFPQGGLGMVDLIYVPEPSSVSLFGLGLLSVIARVRSRQLRTRAVDLTKR